MKSKRNEKAKKSYHFLRYSKISTLRVLEKIQAREKVRQKVKAVRARLNDKDKKPIPICAKLFFCAML